MNEIGQNNGREQAGVLVNEKSKIYFSKLTERKIFFFLTLAMLLLGVFAKLGLF